MASMNQIVLLLMGLRSSVMAKSERLNVLYFVVDDYRNEVAEAYQQSDIKTPNLDKLAETGLVFDRAYCQQAVCSPSRNSFMSGRVPDRTKVYDNANGVNFRNVGPDWITMPEHFKRHDFITLGGGKTFHPNSPPNWDEPKSWSQDKPYFPFEQSKCKYMTTLGSWCSPSNNYSDFYDYRLASHTIELLDYAHSQPDANFFIMAGFRRPHGPWRMPRDFWDMYKTEDIQLAPNMNYTTNAPDLAYFQTSMTTPPHTPDGYPGGPGQYTTYLTNISRPLDFDLQREAKHAYYSAISWMDSQVGRVLQHLEDLGLASTTIVVLHGDHGYHLGEHNMWHKFTNFELTDRVPLIIRAPNKPRSQGQHTQVLAELVDMYPTLAILSNAPPPRDQLDGTDISAVFDDPSKTSIKHAAYSQYPRCPKHDEPQWTGNGCGQEASKGYMGMTIRTADWRYTSWMPFKTNMSDVDWNGDPLAIELYDHGPSSQCAKDFNTCENENVANDPRNKQQIAQLDTMLRQHFKSFSN
eukprot:TRINITY_DN346_c0_g1_i2.p1 TRINITY_DN346_c0_g1~~TRINITY_DN346_c0_g1_i2.p1  ORF type:complete len:522 (+),score=71.18 TRINITY_DN346_c0_g1_i2:2-1567(+)